MKKAIIIAALLLGVAATTVTSGEPDYFPIAIGNVWEHDIMIQGLGGGLQDMGDAKWKVIATTTIGTESFYLCSLQATIQYLAPIETTLVVLLQDNGNDIYLTQNPNSPTALQKIGQHTYEGGETWTADEKTITVSAAGTYTAPAGDFNNCFAASADTDTAAVYAPNVGPLRIKLQFSGMDVHFFLKDYDVTVPSSIKCLRRRCLSHAAQGMFTANDLERTVTFDLGNNQKAALSVYRPNGKLVQKYEIGGMGTINVDKGGAGSGHVLLRLELEGNVYTGKMMLQK
jgi:hypothetical protein